MREYQIIDLIRQLDFFLIVGVVFIFCLWQEHWENTLARRARDLRASGARVSPL